MILERTERKIKIVMIGPVYPYKGGISHYMGMMCRTLAKKNDVITLSYKLQYPKFMYKKEQRDYKSDTFKVDGTDYCINTVNPFNWLRVANKINRINPELVIIQWWHPYFAPCYQVLCNHIKTKEILFVCHNVYPHERFPMDRLLVKSTLKKGKYFIVHSELDEKDLLHLDHQACYKRTVIPTYNVFGKKHLTKEKARELLSISNDSFVLLFFGLVREYKGLKHLLKALSVVKEKIPNLCLYIVGDFAGKRENYQQLIDELEICDNVIIEDGYIPDNEIEKYFVATDMVVLPYESATQSGIVQIAYEFLKPVVVTNVGGLPEVVVEGKTGYVVPPFNPDAIAKAIIKYYRHENKKVFEKGIKDEAYRFDWDRMNELIENLVGGNI